MVDDSARAKTPDRPARLTSVELAQGDVRTTTEQDATFSPSQNVDALDAAVLHRFGIDDSDAEPMTGSSAQLDEAAPAQGEQWESSAPFAESDMFLFNPWQLSSTTGYASAQQEDFNGASLGERPADATAPAQADTAVRPEESSRAAALDAEGSFRAAEPAPAAHFPTVPPMMVAAQGMYAFPGMHGPSTGAMPLGGTAPWPPSMHSASHPMPFYAYGGAQPMSGMAPMMGYGAPNGPGLFPHPLSADAVHAGAPPAPGPGARGPHAGVSGHDGRPDGRGGGPSGHRDRRGGGRHAAYGGSGAQAGGRRGGRGGNHGTLGNGRGASANPNAHGSGTDRRDQGAANSQGLGGGAEFAHLSIADCRGRIYQLSKDQNGCRFLQDRLACGTPEDVAIVFGEVEEHIVELMTDRFGNYLCQKLLEHCDGEQRLALVRRAAPHLAEASLNMHGTRAVQRLIEVVHDSEEVGLVVQALADRVVPLINDLNGNHVVQRCLYRLPDEDKYFILDAVVENCVSVCTHRHGCCVVQRCVDMALASDLERLVSCIISHAFTLVQDPFGNYVVQYVLDRQNAPYIERVIDALAGNFGSLSKQKFSSNVVEKCLQIAESAKRDLIVRELIDKNTIESLLVDPYANYVVQKALTTAPPYLLDEIVEAIRPHMETLRRSPYGKRIIAKISKLLPSFASLSISGQPSAASPVGENASTTRTAGGKTGSRAPGANR